MQAAVYLLGDCPPTRPEFAPPLDDAGAGRWWVVVARPQMEKRLALDLLQRGIDFFLPLAERLTYSGGKRRVTSFPLFGAYLFLRGDEFTPGNALATQKIRQIIDVSNQPKIRADLANLDKALATNPRIEPCDIPVKGQKVEIVDGPLMGVRGVVVERGNGRIIVIEVESCGKATMEIDFARTEPVD